MATILPTTDNPVSFFGTYDIRAIVSETFGETQYRRVAHAFAQWLRQHCPEPAEGYWMAVGYDARTHSPQLESALVKGLVEAGIHVVRLGLVPTPAVYFAEFLSAMDHSGLPKLVGTMTVTASHNPAEYNGIKMTYDKKILNQVALKEVKSLYVAQLTQPLPEQTAGSVTPIDLLPRYQTWLQDHGQPVSTPMKVVIDSGNATGGLVAPELFKALGCDVISLFEEPDGRFPNHHPDPSSHKNLKHLIKTVLTEKADFGMAFDGDSDRLGIVDSDGRVIPGDILLLLFAQHYTQTRSPQSPPLVVVTEVKCSQTLLDQVDAVGGKVVMAPTGHAFIKAAMRENNAVLGGELSGHFFFTDRYLGFDDAFYAAMRFLELLQTHRANERSFTSADLLAALPQTHLSEEKRIFCPPDLRPSVMAQLGQRLVTDLAQAGIDVKEVITIDGLRAVIEGGFILIRPSNTEPCFTMRTETPNEAVEATVSATVNKLLSELIPSQA